MDETADSGGFLQSIGEAVGGFLSAIPPAFSSFFSGVGAGAGVHGVLDWIALILGIALLLSVYKGIKAGRVVGPAMRCLIGIALMGWAVS